MAALYLDEDIHSDATRLLRERGHQAVHAREHRKGAKDDAQLLIAARAGRVLVTNNQGDFLLLHDAWHHWSQAWGVTPQHTGILLARNSWTPEVVAERVSEFFASPRPIANRLYRWVAGRGREERDPTPL